MVMGLLAAADRRLYGHTLLKLLDGFPSAPFSPGAVPVLNNKQETKRRIIMISTFKSSGRLAWASSAALVVVLICLTFTRAAEEKSSAREAAASSPVAKKAAIEPGAGDNAAGGSAQVNIAPLLRVSKSKAKATRAIAVLEEKLKKHEQMVKAVQAEVDSLAAQLGHDASEGAKLDVENLRSIEREAVSLEAQAAKHRALRRELLNKVPGEMLQMLPTVMPDTLLSSMLDRRSNLETDMARVSTEFGQESTHPQAASLRAMIASLDTQIGNRVQGILSGLSAQEAVAAASSNSLRKQIEEAKERDARWTEKSAPFFRAQRELEIKQRIRNTIMLRLLQERVDVELLEDE
jgi:hypothetical protein